MGLADSAAGSVMLLGDTGGSFAVTQTILLLTAHCIPSQQTGHTLSEEDRQPLQMIGGEAFLRFSRKGIVRRGSEPDTPVAGEHCSRIRSQEGILVDFRRGSELCLEEGPFELR